MVVLLALWVLWNVATLAMVYVFHMHDMQSAANQVHEAQLFVQLFTLVFLVTISTLLIWIIHKLLSPGIAVEFTE